MRVENRRWQFCINTIYIFIIYIYIYICIYIHKKHNSLSFSLSLYIYKVLFPKSKFIFSCFSLHTHYLWIYIYIYILMNLELLYFYNFWILYIFYILYIFIYGDGEPRGWYSCPNLLKKPKTDVPCFLDNAGKSAYVHARFPKILVRGPWVVACCLLLVALIACCLRLMFVDRWHGWTDKRTNGSADKQ